MKGGRAVLACAWVPRGHDAPGKGTLVVGSGAVVMGVVSGEAPAANLPQRAVVFVVVGGLLIALEAVGEWGRGARAFALVSGYVTHGHCVIVITVTLVTTELRST